MQFDTTWFAFSVEGEGGASSFSLSAGFSFVNSFTIDGTSVVAARGVVPASWTITPSPNIANTYK